MQKLAQISFHLTAFIFFTPYFAIFDFHMWCCILRNNRGRKHRGVCKTISFHLKRIRKKIVEVVIWNQVFFLHLECQGAAGADFKIVLSFTWKRRSAMRATFLTLSSREKTGTTQILHWTPSFFLPYCRFGYCAVVFSFFFLNLTRSLPV